MAQEQVQYSGQNHSSNLLYPEYLPPWRFQRRHNQLQGWCCSWRTIGGIGRLARTGHAGADRPSAPTDATCRGVRGSSATGNIVTHQRHARRKDDCLATGFMIHRTHPFTGRV